MILYVLVPIVIFFNLAKAQISVDNGVGLALGWLNLALVGVIVWLVASRLMSAMPTGLNAIIVSHAYGLDNRTVAESITWSTAIVVVTAPVSLLF